MPMALALAQYPAPERLYRNAEAGVNLSAVDRPPATNLLHTTETCKRRLITPVRLHREDTHCSRRDWNCDGRMLRIRQTEAETAHELPRRSGVMAVGCER